MVRLLGTLKEGTVYCMKLNIKLGESNGEMAMPSMPGDKKQEEYFPEFTFREDEEPEFPEEGVMEIRYRKVRSSVDKKNKKPYQCTIEVREIVSVESEEEEADEESPTKKYDEAGDALDKLANEKVKSKKSEY